MEEIIVNIEIMALKLYYGSQYNIKLSLADMRNDTNRAEITLYRIQIATYL